MGGRMGALQDRLAAFCLLVADCQHAGSRMWAQLCLADADTLLTLSFGVAVAGAAAHTPLTLSACLKRGVVVCLFLTCRFCGVAGSLVEMGAARPLLLLYYMTSHVPCLHVCVLQSHCCACWPHTPLGRGRTWCDVLTNDGSVSAGGTLRSLNQSMLCFQHTCS
jgi:hypothetical protein